MLSSLVLTMIVLAGSATAQPTFSVDEFAFGLAAPAPSVFNEGAGGLTAASADVWVYLGPFFSIPPGGGPKHACRNDSNSLQGGVQINCESEPFFSCRIDF